MNQTERQNDFLNLFQRVMDRFVKMAKAYSKWGITTAQTNCISVDYILPV